jgi:hypothetical protein
MPPPPKKKGCGVLGTILIIVVAIVVTYFTAGATSGFFASALGSTTGGAVATAATAAAAGSIVSQGVGIAIGQQDSFSWKAVAAAALTAGITKGVGLSGVVDKATAGSEFFNAAAHGLVNNAIGQGVNIAVGVQDSFNWRDLAISAVSAPIANKVGEKVGAPFEGRTSSAFATNVGSSIASAVVRRGSAERSMRRPCWGTYSAMRWAKKS